MIIQKTCDCVPALTLATRMVLPKDHLVCRSALDPLSHTSQGSRRTFLKSHKIFKQLSLSLRTLLEVVSFPLST